MVWFSLLDDQLIHCRWMDATIRFMLITNTPNIQRIPIISFWNKIQCIPTSTQCENNLHQGGIIRLRVCFGKCNTKN